MDKMSPQQQPDSLRGRGQPENRTRLKYQSYRRQSAPSLVFTKALTRSKTLSRESFLVPVCPETCPLVQSFLTGSDRSFLLHGHAQLKTGMQTQERHLFLFTDVLVTAKAKSANNYKQKAQVRVCEIWTAGCMDEVCEGSTNPERSFVMGWPVCNYVATFSSEEQRETWLSLLKSRIKEEKEKEEPKTIPLRVYGKGINSFAITKTLPVSNSDSTNEVVRLALQQFSVIGHVKDYQLWVVSKRDNVPYPLIGHEFPFSVQMSHVRHTFQGDSSKDNAAQPPNKQVAMQLEQLQMCKQCQFILRPRPIETLHLPADLSQKQFRRKRSLMTWAFWRGSSPQLNQLSRDAPRGCLFSQPLNSVCVEGTLPKPVMDMLLFLYSEGSWTRGIFRRPAGARAVRELRDSLDSGDFQLPLTKDHIYVIAGVFKDFLRSIPGSLLSCELHEEWLDLLDEKEEVEGQVQDIKRMICRLPKENSLLLRYLLAMLYGIQGNAKENQMTSFNLSVCIAPSMLWPPSAPCSPEVEGEGTKKVCELVKFMIENCQQILEEDPSSLLGGLPQRLSIDEMESDNWLYPPIDSSYDSLDNELDNSSGGSPGSSSRHYRRPKPLQGSLDSILTFSEYDQDTDPDMHPTQTDSPHGMNLHTLDSARGRRQDPDVYSPSQDAPTVNNSSGVNFLSQDGQHRRRRRSEPAVLFRFAPCVSGSAEGLIGDEDGEEEHSKELSSYSHSINENKQRGDESQFNILDVRSAAMEASSSSLSSTSTPPPPIRSSLDSPDSLHSLSADQPWAKRQGRFEIKTHLPSITSSASISSAPFTTSSALTYGEPRWYQDQESCPKGSPPKETPSWGTLKGCRGLHPNSWLKKGRRLSLTQQDNLEKDGDDGLSQSKGATCEKSLTLGKLLQKGKASGGGGKSISDSQSTPISSCRTSKDAGRGGHVRGMSGQESQHHRQDSSSLLSSQRSTGSLQFPKSSCHSSVSLLTVRPLCDSHVNTEGGTSNLRCAAGSGMNELKHPSASLFYKQSGTSLSLFKENKSHFMEEQYHARLNQRRGSEPARQVMEQASALTRARLPSDPGLKVTEVDSQERATEARFCLSTGATNTVKNYFSQPCSNPQSSQEVARALAESHREWLRRCSDPTAEPDLDQLLFAEESYV